jgi:Ig-like domain-containing protein/SdrD B-like protein
LPNTPRRYRVRSLRFGQFNLAGLAVLAVFAVGLQGCAALVQGNNSTPGSLAISNQAAVSNTPSSVTITWRTNEPSTSQVAFGTTTSYGSTTTLDPTMVTSHVVTISTLSAGTTYYYDASSTNSQNTKAHGGGRFTTAGYNVSGSISPASGGSGATLTLGGAAVATTTADNSGNYTFTGLANGNYSVTPSHAGYTFTPSNQSVSVNNANMTGVNFTDAAQNFSISGTISPTTGGSGATVALSGAATATTTANSSGVYTFTGLVSGSYTITPSNLGYTFSPASQSVSLSTANITGVNFTDTAVAVAPSITTPPANQTVTAGQTATFTVAASGTTPLSYQWQKNGVNISGATASSYTTPATTTSDSGSTFAVVVSNSAGTVTSSVATLTVNAVTTVPTVPTGLVATASTCGQVDLSWGASTDSGGPGLKAYVINRSDGVNTTIGAARTTFSDTNWVRSSTTLTYYVVAQDNAGNNSQPSNQVIVVTPSCSMSLGEQIVDSAYIEPLGKSMATYGTLTAVIYQKLNTFSTRDTWLYVNDSNTGQTSRFLLHSSPSYLQIETDYVLTSATELWTLSCDANSGKLLVSQYQLSGSPPTSATLLSTQSLGDTSSYAMSMIRLQSGALVVSWSDQATAYTGDLIAGYAYRSPTGTWIVHPPVTLASSGGVNQGWKTRMIMAQHPADSSVWMFVKEDTSSAIEALHFTETTSDFGFDWLNSLYITQAADGDNGPETEFPFLAAAPDPTRNAILLAYQSRPYQIVFIDPLYGISNSIFLKQAYATVAQISADASKTFIPFQTYMERASQFGMSVLSDGTIWLAYLPINSQSLTWNEVYASKYQSGVWSSPALTGFNYNNYNQSSGLAGALVYRTDQPVVAFLTPDQKIHTFALQ